MKKIIRITLRLTIIFIITISLILLYFTLSDYNPKEKIIISQSKNINPLENETITILSWNIGYAGLGSNMDFFYDGGTKVRDTKQQTIKNITAISNTLKDYSYVDFIFLQEIDLNSKRTYYINEKKILDNQLNNYMSFFAINYNVQYIPFPVTSPMGKVKSGLITYSKHIPLSSTRYKFPGNYYWPKYLFMPDRCFLCNTYNVYNNKKLILINTHNSAFDKTENLKQKQLKYLKKFITNEYKKGNYVIVAGDWNQKPPDFNTKNFNNNTEFTLKPIDKNYMPKNWKWIHDNTTPTNRSLSTAYTDTETKTTIIDFFLISPNIENINIETINLNFKNTDHQPILGEFKLKKQ